MAISVTRNTNYGGTLITTKYSPFSDIKLTDRNECKGIFQKRIDVLRDTGIFPCNLKLFAKAWPVAVPGTPPMIVPSTNRAKWIKTKLQNMKTKDTVTGYNDPDSFHSDVTLWYTPRRTSPGNTAPRPLYILVNVSEFNQYYSELNGYQDVHIIGWQFHPPDNRSFISGFGPCRFAALQLAKHLGYQKIWLVDDNVININGFPNTLNTIETHMTTDMYGIGFRASTKCIDYGESFNTKTVSFTTVTPTWKQTGLIQQAALWNITKCGILNFSPYFISSNEDVSLYNYLIATSSQISSTQSLAIIKLQPQSDQSNTGASSVSGRRANISMVLYEAEKNIKINSAVNLSDFITNTVLEGKSESKKYNTQCQAVEQILSKAISDYGQTCLPDKIFNPYDGTVTVQQITLR